MLRIKSISRLVLKFSLLSDNSGKYPMYHPLPARSQSFTNQIRCTSKFNQDLLIKSHFCKTTRPYKTCEEDFKLRKTSIRHHQIRFKRKVFQCDDCGKRFYFKSKLKGHVVTHTNERSFPCQSCGKAFRLKFCLKRHLRTHNKDKQFLCDIKTQSEMNSFFCQTCGLSFKHEGSLNTHIGLNHREKLLCCCICKVYFPSKAFLDQHSKTHANVKPFSCESCGKKFKCKDSLSDHLRVHYEENRLSCEACEACEEQFSLKCGLQEHLLTCSSVKFFQCETCGKAFSIKWCLSKHLLEIHGIFSCGICDRQFARKTYLNKHFEVHSDEKPFTCEICSKKFRRKEHLTKHRRIHSREKSVSCETCMREFQLKSDMDKHLVDCPGNRPFSCHVCGEAFRWWSHFNEHLNSHCDEILPDHESCQKTTTHSLDLNGHRAVYSSKTRSSSAQKGEDEIGTKCNYNQQMKAQIHCEEKIHSCSICGKKFSSETDVTEHKRIHGSFPCGSCNETFRYKLGLMLHGIVHNGDINTQYCGKCGKQFNLNSDFDEHFKSHSDNVDFVCMFCSKLYWNKFDLMAHEMNKCCKMHT